MCKSDVVSPRRLIEEPGEHVLSYMMQKREFIVGELITIEKNRRSKVMAMFEINLKTFRSKGKLKDYYGGIADYEQSTMSRKEFSSRSSEN